MAAAQNNIIPSCKFSKLFSVSCLIAEDASNSINIPVPDHSRYHLLLNSFLMSKPFIETIKT